MRNSTNSNADPLSWWNPRTKAMNATFDSNLRAAGFTRRRLLKGAAGVATAAALMPPNLQRALAQQPSASALARMFPVVLG
jgi:hypothetical protein